MKKGMPSISVIGLGKLGLCMAACFAEKGCKVTGVDVNRKKVTLINKGISPIEETNLDRLIKKCKRNLKATNSYREAILNSQVTFIVVATPSGPDGSYSNKQLKEALRGIGALLKEKTDYHLVVITSTVTPGATEYVGKHILEKTSGKICGRDFGLAYNPEFIALGSVIHNFLNPDFVLIGETNKKDGDLLTKIYKRTCENNPYFARMNAVNAEIAKISLNCYITMKITFANSLAAICERVKGSDAEIITDAIGLDSRIGKKYLKPGLGFGGPCFPRDNTAFSVFTKKIGASAKLAETVDNLNNSQALRAVKRLKKLTSKLKKPKKDTLVGILGLSYKPDTSIIERSQSIDMIKILLGDRYKIIVYDPAALKKAKSIFRNRLIYAKSGRECVRRSDILLLATPWREFQRLDINSINKNLLVLDCWGFLKDKGIKRENIIYVGKEG